MTGMPRLYLVRHGRPEATFSQAPDAGLDRTGLEQAEVVADRLAALGPTTAR
jgi:broad specificity phosphatase PhoE